MTDQPIQVMFFMDTHQFLSQKVEKNLDAMKVKRVFGRKLAEHVIQKIDIDKQKAIVGRFMVKDSPTIIVKRGDIMGKVFTGDVDMSLVVEEVKRLASST